MPVTKTCVPEQVARQIYTRLHILGRYTRPRPRASSNVLQAPWVNTVLRDDPEEARRQEVQRKRTRQTTHDIVAFYNMRGKSHINDDLWEMVCDILRHVEPWDDYVYRRLVNIFHEDHIRTLASLFNLLRLEMDDWARRKWTDAQRAVEMLKWHDPAWLPEIQHFCIWVLTAVDIAQAETAGIETRDGSFVPERANSDNVMPRDWVVPLRFGTIVEFDVQQPHSLRKVLQRFKEEYGSVMGIRDDATLDGAFPKRIRGLHVTYEADNDYDSHFDSVFSAIYYERDFRLWRDTEQLLWRTSGKDELLMVPLAKRPIWMRFVLHPSGAANRTSHIKTDLWPNPFKSITTHTDYEAFQVCRLPPVTIYHGLSGQDTQYSPALRRRYAIPEKPNGVAQGPRGEAMPETPMPSDSEDEYSFDSEVELHFRGHNFGAKYKPRKKLASPTLTPILSQHPNSRKRTRSLSPPHKNSPPLARQRLFCPISGCGFSCPTDLLILQLHIHDEHASSLDDKEEEDQGLVQTLTPNQRVLYASSTALHSRRTQKNAARREKEVQMEYQARREKHLARALQQENRQIRRFTRLRRPMDRQDATPPYLHRYRVATPEETGDHSLPPFGRVGRPWVNTQPVTTPDLSTPSPISSDTDSDEGTAYFTARNSAMGSVYESAIGTPVHNPLLDQQLLSEARIQARLESIERRRMRARKRLQRDRLLCDIPVVANWERVVNRVREIEFLYSLDVFSRVHETYLGIVQEVERAEEVIPGLVERFRSAEASGDEPRINSSREELHSCLVTLDELLARERDHKEMMYIDAQRRLRRHRQDTAYQGELDVLCYVQAPGMSSDIPIAISDDSEDLSSATEYQSSSESDTDAIVPKPSSQAAASTSQTLSGTDPNLCLTCNRPKPCPDDCDSFHEEPAPLPTLSAVTLETWFPGHQTSLAQRYRFPIAQSMVEFFRAARPQLLQFHRSLISPGITPFNMASHVLELRYRVEEHEAVEIGWALLSFVSSWLGQQQCRPTDTYGNEFNRSLVHILRAWGLKMHRRIARYRVEEQLNLPGYFLSSLEGVGMEEEDLLAWSLLRNISSRQREMLQEISQHLLHRIRIHQRQNTGGLDVGHESQGYSFTGGGERYRARARLPSPELPATSSRPLLIEWHACSQSPPRELQERQRRPYHLRIIPSTLQKPLGLPAASRAIEWHARVDTSPPELRPRQPRPYSGTPSRVTDHSSGYDHGSRTPVDTGYPLVITLSGFRVPPDIGAEIRELEDERGKPSRKVCYIIDGVSYIYLRDPPRQVPQWCSHCHREAPCSKGQQKCHKLSYSPDTAPCPNSCGVCFKPVPCPTSQACLDTHRSRLVRFGSLAPPRNSNSAPPNLCSHCFKSVPCPNGDKQCHELNCPPGTAPCPHLCGSCFKPVPCPNGLRCHEHHTSKAAVVRSRSPRPYQNMGVGERYASRDLMDFRTRRPTEHGLRRICGVPACRRETVGGTSFDISEEDIDPPRWDYSRMRKGKRSKKDRKLYRKRWRQRERRRQKNKGSDSD